MNYLNKEIVIIGLGYVGLPLAVKLAANFKVIGYDISIDRIKELKDCNDSTKEIKKNILRKAKNLIFTSDKSMISNRYIYIITVPTPVKKNKLPDLSILKNACKLVGKNIHKGAIIIFESTVYPGVTNNICAPIIAKESKFNLNEGFYLGYSPERINPGDSKHSLDKIIKVISGSNNKITKTIGKIYETIITAGVFYAKSIEVAETAKAIENAQRDINIAFVNEVSLLCQRLNISVYDVLNAAKTKWNFLPFHPGLVGGHCIGVDPYYLAHIAKKLNSSSEVILSGRRLNDSMTGIVFKEIEKQIMKGSRILQIGISFKENVPDIRNSKSAELAQLFIEKKYKIDINDPVVNPKEVQSNFGIKLSKLSGKYDYIIIAVAHNFIYRNNINILKYTKKSSTIFDITGKFKNKLSKNNIKYWSL
ncbi:MAG: UDP-N-acetyl-D-glucosamine 6-dehydrogenase [Alphaproteobacteria bacterium MarineAlpha9_Bin3]|nr:MAG: UDP-N-acetyl-D-glucosamine 6-dehydrogenase [Alphaproteobacteria bacterium MarineAlpha9_Bin3]